MFRAKRFKGMTMFEIASMIMGRNKNKMIIEKMQEKQENMNARLTPQEWLCYIKYLKTGDVVIPEE